MNEEEEDTILNIVRIDLKYYNPNPYLTMEEWIDWNNKQKNKLSNYIYINTDTEEIITNTKIINKFEKLYHEETEEDILNGIKEDLFKEHNEDG